MKFDIINGERKKVLERLEKLAGAKAQYTRAPRFAYILNGIVLEKDNTVTTEDGADMAILRILEAEGLIRDAEPYPEEEHTDAEEPIESEETPADEVIEEVTEEPAEEADGTAESDGIAEPLDTATENVVSEEIVEYHVGNPPESIEQPVETAVENETAAETELPAGSYDDLVERIEPVHPMVSFPLSKHRAESVCNLVFTIYSKGKLLSKATGGRFYASEELVETLRSENFRVPADVLSVLKDTENGELTGLRFTEEEVIFDGFPETEVKEEIQAWTELCAAINKAAIRQKHVRAKRTEEANEKFAFRTWLTRMGMNGSELKAERSLLYRNLDGHTAFRTAADEKKWKARQAVKRQELLDAKAAAEANTVQTLMEA